MPVRRDVLGQHPSYRVVVEISTVVPAAVRIAGVHESDEFDVAVVEAVSAFLSCQKANRPPRSSYMATM